MKSITIFVLFIANMATGEREPLVAFTNSETCWAYASIVSADGIDADCRLATVAGVTGEQRSALAPVRSIRPRARPW